MKKLIGRWRILLLVMLVLIASLFLLKPKETVPDYVFTYAENQVADYPTTLGEIGRAHV